MLIVLPPSQGKTPAAEGPPVDVASMVAPQLNATRKQLMAAVEKLCSGRGEKAVHALKLGRTQAGTVDYNAQLSLQPAARADAVYTGVLYDELAPATMPKTMRLLLDDNVLIASALFGLVRPSDLIPAYRLTPNVTLPRLGTVASRWRPMIGKTLARLSRGQMLLDLRSSPYQQLGPPESDLAQRTTTLRILHDRGGKRSVVSHFNKAYKGRIVRQLIAAEAQPASALELASVLDNLGWAVDQPTGAVTKTGTGIDVIV